jgi:leucyl aminopeptidase
MKALVVLSSDKDIKKHLGAELAKRVAEATPVKNMINPNFAHKDYDYITVWDGELKTEQDYRDFGGNMFSRFKGKVSEMDIYVPKSMEKDVGEGVNLSAYEFNRYKSDESKTKLKVDQILVNGKPCNIGISDSVNMARDLVTEPGNKLYPEKYAYRVNDTLSKLGVTVKVYHQKQLETMGFDLLLSVGQGSVNDSYVVVMEWMKGDTNEKPIALVGKGVTFDTGGISLKPSAGMGDMKFDMGGSAAVVGAIHAIASNNIKKNVVGIIGLVENMPDGNSIKPGDVVTSLSGKTVENLNTDAEGRLVLADILTYVQAFYDPHTVIDLATLTGAILVSLGNDIAGLFTNSSELSNTIDAVGKASGEDFWRMPMGKAWRSMLDSDIADIKNIGGGRYGGSTTAAEFLYEFIDEGRSWAHLDIAGTVWSESGKPTSPKGAVGFGVRTLFNMVTNESGRTFEIDEDMNY